MTDSAAPDTAAAEPPEVVEVTRAQLLARRRELLDGMDLRIRESLRSIDFLLGWPPPVQAAVPQPAGAPNCRGRDCGDERCVTCSRMAAYYAELNGDDPQPATTADIERVRRALAETMRVGLIDAALTEDGAAERVQAWADFVHAQYLPLLAGSAVPAVPPGIADLRAPEGMFTEAESEQFVADVASVGGPASAVPPDPPWLQAVRDRQVALAWHDVTCPEGDECRDRGLHALSEPLLTAGVLHRFLAAVPDPPSAPTEGYVIAGPQPGRPDRMECDWDGDGEVHSSLPGALAARDECRAAGYPDWHAYALVRVSSGVDTTTSQEEEQ